MVRAGNSPWMTNDIRKLIKKKRKLLRQSRRGIITRRSYSYFRNMLNYVIKLYKQIYYCTKINSCSGDAKQTWKVLNNMIKRKVKSPSPDIAVNGVKLSDGDSAEVFNGYFTSVAGDLVGRLPQPLNGPSILIEPVERSCYFYPVDCSEIDDLIQSFKSDHCSKDNFQPFLLSTISVFIVPVLTSIFNLCFSTGIYPNILKTARVVPIFKQGDSSDVSNYRPISTLSIFNKMLETVIHKRLHAYFSSINVMSDRQFGFRRGFSTTQAVTSLIDYITVSLRERKDTVCLFLDLRKAFDTVDQPILMEKLGTYGVRGVCGDIIKSYLTNREQYVAIGDSVSSKLPVKIGVPQGSVLGPFLFSIFINDIVRAVDGEVILFADDAVFYVSDRELDKVVEKLEVLTCKLSLWLSNSKLLANEGKTKLMLFSNRPSPLLPVVKFNNVSLEWVNKFKYLGVILDNKLSFNDQIALVCSKLGRGVGVLYRVSKLLPIDTLKTLYFSLVYCHIVSSIVIWGGVSDNKLKPIDVLLNKALRIILDVKYDFNHVPLVSTVSMYRSLNLLRIRDIYRYFLFKFSHWALFDNRNAFISYIQPCIPTHQYSRRYSKYNLPGIRLEVERCSVRYQCIKLMNELPDNMLRPMSKFSLKKVFMDFIMRTYI